MIGGLDSRLTRIELEGVRWYHSWWLRHQLRRSAGRPVNFERLKTGLQLLRASVNLRQINAELKPGGTPGENLLHVVVAERQPFRLGVEFNNARPPSVGAEQVEVQAQQLNAATGQEGAKDRRPASIISENGSDVDRVRTSGRRRWWDEQDSDGPESPQDGDRRSL